MKIFVTDDGKSIIIEGLVIVKTNGRYAYKAPLTLNGYKWYDELSDPDPFFPSCPHLHCTEKPYKLNVYTGELYNVQTKQIIRNEKIRTKELKELWKDKRFFEFVLFKRNEFLSQHPDAYLPTIPCFEQRNRLHLKKYRFMKVFKRRF